MNRFHGLVDTFQECLKISLHIFAFQNIPSVFKADKGFAPLPSLADMSDKNDFLASLKKVKT